MIAVVLTSSVLAALISSGLTSWINWLIQRNNYRNDYYKKVLDKRIAAYEAISEIITHLDQFSTANGSKWHKFYDQGVVFLGKSALDIQHLYSQAMWINKTLFRLLS